MSRQPKVLQFIGSQQSETSAPAPLAQILAALSDFISSEVERRVSAAVAETRAAAIESEKTETYVTAKEVGAILGCAETTVINLADGGKIPCLQWTENTRTMRRFQLSAVIGALGEKRQ